MSFFHLVVFIITAFCGYPVLAQEGVDSSYQQRLDLAYRMIAIRPVRPQVETAVDAVVLSLPDTDRASFKEKVLKTFDFDALSEVSAKAMADVYTADELKKMVEYHSSAEAQSIEKKTPMYRQLLAPQLSKILDAAIMTARTGASVPESAPAPVSGAGNPQ